MLCKEVVSFWCTQYNCYAIQQPNYGINNQYSLDHSIQQCHRLESSSLYTNSDTTGVPLTLLGFPHITGVSLTLLGFPSQFSSHYWGSPHTTGVPLTVLGFPSLYWGSPHTTGFLQAHLPSWDVFNSWEYFFCRAISASNWAIFPWDSCLPNSWFSCSNILHLVIRRLPVALQDITTNKNVYSTISRNSK